MATEMRELQEPFQELKQLQRDPLGLKTPSAFPDEPMAGLPQANEPGGLQDVSQNLQQQVSGETTASDSNMPQSPANVRPTPTQRSSRLSGMSTEMLRDELRRRKKGSA